MRKYAIASPAVVSPSFESFGACLHYLRRRARLTQRELAIATGYSPEHISRLEHNRRTPDPAAVQALFVPALDLDNAPELHAQLLALAGAVRPPRRSDRPDPTSDASPLSRLPVPVTPLIGREREVHALRQRLLDPQVRLVTLTATGGIGKTRLALQVAAELRDNFADGVWFVDLAPIRDPNLVLATIAATLGVKEMGGRQLGEVLSAYLGPKLVLLVLDNFEQVLAAASLVTDLLRAASGLKVLVTSRALLHLSGEHAFAVPPLAVPDPQHVSDLAALAKYAAVALYIQRAQAVNPDFQLTDDNAQAVIEICACLDGLPLAIELAAARTKLLPPRALLARLASRLHLLTSGPRDLPVRQQTLRQTIDWSYDLLDTPERTLFARLAVFVGGWTIEAAEVVCNVAGDLGLDVLDVLQALCDKSLVRPAIGARGESRFSLSETLREYALERLQISGALSSLQQQHAAYFLALVETADNELRVPQQRIWLEWLKQEHDNLRAALTWTFASGNLAMVARLSGALWRFWSMQGYLSEGRHWLAAAMASGTDVHAAVRANVLMGAGALADRQGAYTAARAHLQESLALSRALGDTPAIAASLNYLGNVAWSQGDDAARALHEESLALARSLGDRPGIAASLNHLGNIAYVHGEYAAARAHLEESLALSRALGDKRFIAWSLSNLGRLAQAHGEYVAARAQFEESLALRRAIGDQPGILWSLNNLGCLAQAHGEYAAARALHEESLVRAQGLGDQRGIAFALEGIAVLASAQGEAVRALSLAGAAAALRAAIGATPELAAQTKIDEQLAPARRALRTDEQRAAWAEGQALTLEQAVAYGLDQDAARS